MAILVGTSGWQYEDWRGSFYPQDLPKGAWLAHLAKRLPTVEVNSSFYRLPPSGVFRSWREQTPDGFVVAVKASRYITHVRRLRECRDPLALLWSRVQELGPRLGPVLFQLPPRFPAAPGRLRDFLAVLPPRMRAAFEFRDPSWVNEEVLALLDEAGAAFVLADRPGARVPDLVTGGWSYVRFHQGRYDGPDYPREKLRRWARRISALSAREVLAYFNNDAGGAAVRDALTLTELLSGARKDGSPRTR
ncbi:MAG TPA: DUF72 domain-containing protein [Actinomycetota bacterium]